MPEIDIFRDVQGTLGLPATLARRVHRLADNLPGSSLPSYRGITVVLEFPPWDILAGERAVVSIWYGAVGHVRFVPRLYLSLELSMRLSREPDKFHEEENLYNVCVYIWMGLVMNGFAGRCWMRDHEGLSCSMGRE